MIIPSTTAHHNFVSSNLWSTHTVSSMRLVNGTGAFFNQRCMVVWELVAWQ